VLTRRPSAIFIIIVGTILVFGSAAYGAFNSASAQPTTVTLPKSLAGLPLVTATYGPEAVTEINRLHGKTFPLTAGAMGHYGNDMVTLWVSKFASRAVAQQIIDAMRSKIAEGRSPFEPTGPQQVGSHLIYELDGLGQKHFYFQSNDLVIWLAVDPAMASRALTQTLEVYP
jgi:hypothetical protein